jgi:tetratricopeptide (TPR) repeat protein
MIVMVFLTAFYATADDFTDELQWLAMQTACIGQYNAAQTGDYTLGDPHDYYKPSDIRDYLTVLSGERTRTQTFYGVCFDYAQAAYDDIAQYRSHYESLGMQKGGWYIVSDGTSSRQIVLYDPVTRGQHTLRINGVYVKEKERRNVQTHENAKNHAWLWVFGIDGTIYWIDPTWTDNTGYVWWGVVRDGKEIQLAPLESVCMVKIDTNAPSFASFNSGNANKNMGKWDQAIADYTATLQSNPNNTAALSSRGNAYIWKGDYDRAITDLSTALRLNPNNAIALNSRGWLYNHRGNYDQAIADFNAALRINQNYADALKNRGNAYIWKGDYDRAITDCDTALRIDPNNASALNNRGNAYLSKREYDRAIVDFTAAIGIDPNFVDALKNRGNAYIWKGDYDRAITDCNTALRIDPNNASALNSRGWLYNQRGDYDRAIADCTAALRINPNFSDAKKNLEVAQRRGR